VLRPGVCALIRECRPGDEPTLQRVVDLPEAGAQSRWRHGNARRRHRSVCGPPPGLKTSIRREKAVCGWPLVMVLAPPATGTLIL